MKLVSAFAATLLALQAAPTLAQVTETTQSSPGKATMARTRTVTAVVTEVDAAAGTVTLKGPDGRIHPLKAGPDVRNLAQVAVGQRVTVRYLESLTLTLKKDGKVVVGGTATAAGARTKAGELPGGALAAQAEVTADVIAVDSKAQIVTLKGPQQTMDLRVRDPAQLKLIKVGDQVHAVYTQAVAVSVQPAPASK
jgi:Cu/Ag efflux protein CusF